MHHARWVTIIGNLTILATSVRLSPRVIVPVSEGISHAGVTNGECAPGTIIQCLTVDLTGVNVVAIQRNRLEHWPSLHQELLQEKEVLT